MEGKYIENSLKEVLEVGTNTIIYYYRSYTDKIYITKIGLDIHNIETDSITRKGYYRDNDSFRTEYSVTPMGAYLFLEQNLRK